MGWGTERKGTSGTWVGEQRGWEFQEHGSGNREEGNVKTMGRGTESKGTSRTWVGEQRARENKILNMGPGTEIKKKKRNFGGGAERKETWNMGRVTKIKEHKVWNRGKWELRNIRWETERKEHKKLKEHWLGTLSGKHKKGDRRNFFLRGGKRERKHREYKEHWAENREQGEISMTWDGKQREKGNYEYGTGNIERKGNQELWAWSRENGKIRNVGR